MTVSRLETARTTMKLAEKAFQRAQKRLAEAEAFLEEEERYARDHGHSPDYKMDRLHRKIWASCIP